MNRNKIIFSFLLTLSLMLPAFYKAAGAAEIKKAKLVQGGGKGPIVSAVIPPLRGPKKFIAVQGFENKVENPQAYWYRNPQLGTGMSDMTVTALMDSGYFIVIEREQMGAIIQEQDLAASGRTTQTGGAKIGKINQAQTMIRGAVTLFEEGTQSKGGGIGGALGGIAIGFGGSGSESQVAVDIRVFDTATSQVLAAKTCKGFAKSKGRSLSIGLAGSVGGSAGALGFGGADFEKTPIGDATRQAITSAVNFIITEMNKIPWAGYVMKISEDGKIFINCGKRNNINVGDSFAVFKRGEAFEDPESGENLGAEETFLGEVQVVSLQEKFGIVTKTSGAAVTKDCIIRFKET